ncbi:class I SAM-dependent methyltransferase [Plantactinospora sp. KBS50]|uniref:class I SAM-dependent methyltransferase n=1 Tax=Plantactinospora sp. KBS50 TaxID=2024580 RepID=UPI000BAAE03E|nr:class I SAM-dependent methyltransferase [Plantactinospora sp. KBS50]ASW53005.1 SAM-dependent methyltransferase [Plantactinospora sp. KBS50]
MTRRDWLAWHDAYRDPDSALSHRLRIVRRRIAEWLDERPEDELRVVSACAGQGHDLIGALSSRADARRVRAVLLEYDPRNVALARASAERAGLSGVTVHRADAGELSSYAGAVPADLVLMAGVFGNVTDADLRGTVFALPRLCSPGGTVIWTRHRDAPDRTPEIRRWFAEAGFAERAFDAPQDARFSVGVHRLTGPVVPLGGVGRLFSFVR